MRVIAAVVLGLIQGLTEFLPVSSTGHLIIFQRIFQFPYSISFDVSLHLATALAALFYFWKEVQYLIASFFAGILNPIASFRRYAKFRMSLFIIIGSMPAAIAGFLFADKFEKLFGSLYAVGLFLIGTGIIILIAENIGRPSKNERQITFWDAIIVGLFQAIAIAPGLSRSGATISAALMRGIRRQTSARFSFLLSLPVIFGAGFYQLCKAMNESLPVTGLEIIGGSVTAFISGYFAIHFLLRIIKRGSIKGFAYYCFILGISVVALHFLTSF